MVDQWVCFAARQSQDRHDFALVAMLGLLGPRFFEATAADIAGLGDPAQQPRTVSLPERQ